MEATLNKLLTLPEPDWKWAPSTFSDFSISEQDALIAITKEEHLHGKFEEDISDAQFFASIHAYRALASFNHSVHLAHFLELLTHPGYDDNDFFSEDIPSILAQYETAAVQPIIDILNDQDIDEITRMPLVDALEKLTQNKIEAATIIKVLTDYLREKHFTRTLNAHIIASMVDLKQTDAIETIRSSYAAHLVDITMSGDLEDIEVALGLRSERETERKNINEYDDEELHLAIKENIGPRPDDDDIPAKIIYLISLYGRECSIHSPGTLQGFLCGVLLAPRFIPLSEYMPAIWDSSQTGSVYAPIWENKEDAEFFLQFLMAMHNAAAEDLSKKDLKVLHESHPEDNETPLYAGWFIGLGRGLDLWQDSVDDLTDIDEDIQKIIRLSAEIINREVEADMNGSIPETSKLFAKLKQDLYALYQTNAQSPNLIDFPSGSETYYREHPKISRSGPCPCGSGKKYKRCCLN